VKRHALAALAALALAGCATTSTTASAPVGAALATERIKRFQYLYGSGEAAAVSIQTYHALVDFARQRVAERPSDSVVLAEGSTLAEARFLPCGDKPFAAVFDVDETVLLNLGIEAHEAGGRRSPARCSVAGPRADRPPSHRCPARSTRWTHCARWGSS